MPRLRPVALWAAFALLIVVPLAIAATSPLLEWRQPVYIAAGFAGVLGMAILLVQPLLASGRLPGLPLSRSRRLHRLGGGLLLACIMVHVAGLWIFSPPDVIDALLLRSPTPFSLWGVIAMWAIFGAAALVLLRRRLRPMAWRRLHSALVTIAVAGSVAHAVLIEGTMGQVSKIALCVAVLLATAAAVRPVWRRGQRR